MAELPFDVLATVKNVQDLHVLILNGIDDHVLSDREAAQSWA